MNYLRELSLRKNGGKGTDVKELLGKKIGCPLIHGENLDNQVQEYLRSLHSNGAVINTAITIACAKGIVKNYNNNLLKCNGGHISLTKNWAKYVTKRMGFVKRRASSTAKVSVNDFERY